MRSTNGTSVNVPLDCDDLSFCRAEQLRHQFPSSLLASTTRMLGNIDFRTRRTPLDFCSGVHGSGGADLNRRRPEVFITGQATGVEPV